MSQYISTLTIEHIKQNAKLLGKSLNTLNMELSHSAALNLSSQGFGFRDYNTAKAVLEKNFSDGFEIKEGMKRVFVLASAKFDIPQEWEIVDTDGEGLLIKTGDKSYLSPFVSFMKNYIDEEEDAAFYEAMLPHWTEKERLEWEADRDDGIVSFRECRADEYPLSKVVRQEDGAIEMRFMDSGEMNKKKS